MIATETDADTTQVKAPRGCSLQHTRAWPRFRSAARMGAWKIIAGPPETELSSSLTGAACAAEAFATLEWR